MTGIETYEGWLIRSGNACYGTPASLLRQHAEHLRYWAGKACTAAAATAIERIAGELDLVRHWAETHQPRDTSGPRNLGIMRRTPDRSSD